MWRAPALVPVLALAAAAALEAGDPPNAVDVGDRVRIKAPSLQQGRISGRLLERAGDSFVIEHGTRPVRVPVSAIESLEVHRGRRSRWKEGGLIGFVPGAVLGGLVGAYAACDDQPRDCSGAGGATAGALLVGGTTAVLGAGMGALFKVDRWQRTTTVRLNPTVGQDRKSVV